MEKMSVNLRNATRLQALRKKTEKYLVAANLIEKIFILHTRP